MATGRENKKTAEEGKNVKDKKAKSAKPASTSKNDKTKTVDRPDVNSDVEQE